MENPPRGPFPYAFDEDGRAVGVHHPSRQCPPAPPFPSASGVANGYHDQLRRGDTPASDRDGPTAHGRRHQERGSAFEANVHPSTGGGGRPVYRYKYDGGEVDGYRRGGPEHWQEPGRPYPGASVSLSYSKYRGEDIGKFGGGMGTPVGSGKTWTQHRQYQGGR